ncbi:DUF4388 domain-containing protein [Citrifermentans bremense]|uniref:DUF4388 domain-containing protein n=1 Tax=Citrifermentans bremense TaxID=60035 RepID=UPI0004248BAC|nr:DUF4388 domain-containing protein [Citrifermentans bremense]
MGILFQVELSFMPIPDILQWIDMNRLTCVVAITRESDSGITFYLENGKLVLAGSQKKGLQFGQFLAASGVLPEVQVFQALTESKSKGISLTRYLVETSLVSSNVLADIMSDLVEKLLLDCSPTTPVQSPSLRRFPKFLPVGRFPWKQGGSSSTQSGSTTNRTGTRSSGMRRSRPSTSGFTMRISSSRFSLAC